MASHALKIACLAFSAPIPAPSKREPIMLSSPCKNLMKSSTRRASRIMTATMAMVFRLILLASFRMDWSPDVILLKLKAANSAPAVIATRRRSLSVPPSLSDSHSIRVCTLRSTSITMLKPRTIVVPMAVEMPRVSSILATHWPHWFRMFSSASVMLYLVFAKAAPISFALSTKVAFRSAREILPSDASCSS